MSRMGNLAVVGVSLGRLGGPGHDNWLTCQPYLIPPNTRSRSLPAASLVPVSCTRNASAERLVVNLVDNAIRHNRPGGWIELRTATETGRAVLRVANSGPAVPPSEVDRLLRPLLEMLVRAAEKLNDKTGVGVQDRQRRFAGDQRLPVPAEQRVAPASSWRPCRLSMCEKLR
jgi:hypothetical protein